MTTQLSSTVEGRLLEIRHLHVLSGIGPGGDHRTVSCPTDGRSVPLERCLACADSGGLVPASHAHGEFVSCRRAAGRGAAAPLERTPVRAIMSTDVFAVRPDVSLETFTELLLERGFGGAPVVDEDGRPIGVVSASDLLDERFIAGDTREEPSPAWDASRGPLWVELGRGVHAEAIPQGSVAEIMSRVALTVDEDTLATEAAARMAERGIHRVVVVSGDGRVAGILTTSDIVRWVARRRGYGGAAARA